MKIKSAVLSIDGAAVQEHLAAGLKLIMNVSREADLAFMAELKRTDRARYNRLAETMRKQAYKEQKAA